MLHCKIIFVEKNLISLKPTAYSNHSQIPVGCRRLRRPAKRNELFKIVQEQNVNSLNRCKVRAPHRKRAGRKYNMEISYYSLFLGSPRVATPTFCNCLSEMNEKVAAGKSFIFEQFSDSLFCYNVCFIFVFYNFGILQFLYFIISPPCFSSSLFIVLSIMIDFLLRL